MRRPLFSAAFAGLLILGATAPSPALCVLCNAVVRLDSGLAACFAERADSEMQAASASKGGFVIVDLKDCSSRGGLPTAQSQPVPLDTEFVADPAGIKCLASQIAALDDTALMPSHQFDLTKDCPAH
jgi:hypothetical protein